MKIFAVWSAFTKPKGMDAAQRLYERRGWRRDQDFRSYGLAL